MSRTRFCLFLLSSILFKSFIALGMEQPRPSLADLITIADEFDADDEMNDADTSTHEAAAPNQAPVPHPDEALDKAIRHREFAIIRHSITDSRSANNVLLRALELGAAGTVEWLLREIGASADAETANGTAAMVIAAYYHEGRPRDRMIQLLIAHNPVRLNPINPRTGNYLVDDLNGMRRTAASQRIAEALLARARRPSVRANYDGVTIGSHPA